MPVVLRKDVLASSEEDEALEEEEDEEDSLPPLVESEGSEDEDSPLEESEEEGNGEEDEEDADDEETEVEEEEAGEEGLCPRPEACPRRQKACVPARRSGGVPPGKRVRSARRRVRLGYKRTVCSMELNEEHRKRFGEEHRCARCRWRGALDCTFAMTALLVPPPLGVMI